MSMPPTTRLAVFSVIAEHGPLHSSAIAEILNMKSRTIVSSIRVAHQRKLLHICGWKRSFGTKGRWGAIYALGEGQDRKPPRINPCREADVRYRAKYREVIRLRTQKSRGKAVHPWLAILGAA